MLELSELLEDSFNSFACLVLRAVAATAIFVALEAGAFAGQKDAQDERPYFLYDIPVIQKKRLFRENRRFCQILCILFLAANSVTAHELINTTGSVDEFLFAGEEGVR